MIVLLIMPYFFTGTAFSEELKINFAGFAFSGSYAHIEKNYPFTVKISNEKGSDQRSVLDVFLAEKIDEIKLKNGKIVRGELAEMGDGSLTLACSIDTELVSVEKYSDGYKLVIDIGGQALFFDYSQMKVVASYPIMVELIDFLHTKPSDEQIKGRIRDILITNKHGVNFFDDFISALNGLELKKSYGSSMKVSHVIIEEKAFKVLPEKFKNNPLNFQSFVAQVFGKFLSQNQRVSILPYTKGHDIGNKMALRFSDSRVFELTIPDPEFSIELTIRGFKKVCTEEKKSGSSWVYGTYARLKIEQPVLGKVYVDEKTKYAVNKIVSATQENVDDWPIFQNSLLALFNNLTKEFSSEDRFEGVRKVIKKCN